MAAQRRWPTSTLAAVAVAVVVLLAASAATTAEAQSAPAAAPGPAGPVLDQACLTALLNMSDCLTYVQNGSRARRPDKPCCPELAGLVESNPVCLCKLLSGAGDSYGIAVDYSRALALPAICRVSTPPVSTCAAFGFNVPMGPTPSPSPAAVSPSGEGPQFPGTSPFASPPSTATPSTNAAAAGRSGDHLVAVGVAIAAAAVVVAGMFRIV
ncbi:non-specific lipid transfer protein GPI-anchored 12-like [Oryza glaberrima]|uniref:non-specific lipid transfer protein GPI-anchored 12-like n=1 Tax=Oryza glaberrima TaxID=4538 RepID=UPI00224C1E1E|nr:non-specific lipid transfer protein GPI-anchored 12-like [Oryza glaberrima]